MVEYWHLQNKIMLRAFNSLIKSRFSCSVMERNDKLRWINTEFRLNIFKILRQNDNCRQHNFNKHISSCDIHLVEGEFSDTHNSIQIK